MLYASLVMCHLLSAACQDVSSFVRWTFIIIIYPFCPLCCQDVSSFVSSLSRCVIFCQVDIYYYLSFLSLVLSRCVIFCQQPVKMCHLLSGGHLLLLFILFVPCAVKMCHLLSAACQDVSSFVRWTFIIIYPFCPLCCQDVSSFVSSLSRCVIFCQVDIYYYYLSFLSLVLSRCVIFCQQPVKMCHLLSGGHLLLFILFVPCAVKMCHLLSAACQDVSSFVRWTFIIIYPFCPLCCQDVSSFVSSLSRCVIFCQVDIYYYYLSFLSLVLSRCVIFCQQPVKMCHLLSGGHLLLFILFVPCAVKMCHLLSAACQDVSSFVRWTFIIIIYPFCPLCCQDVSSFVSSLSRCVIFCQVDIYYYYLSFLSLVLSRCAIFCQVDIYYLSEVNHCGQQYNRGKPERAPVLLIEHGTYIAHTKIS